MNEVTVHEGAVSQGAAHQVEAHHGEIDEGLLELNRKIDLLTAQVQFLTEQAQAAERERAERSDLMHDLTPIVNDAYRLTVEQLEEVEQYVDLNDLLRLMKRLLRNGRNFDKLLDQVESAMDLLETVGPISDQAFGKAVEVLEQMEQKGYFVFAKGGLQIMDNVVSSFGEEDVRSLGDNIVLILNVVKEMTQPEIMNFVHNTVEAVDREKDQPVNTSLVSLMSQMRDPDVRRGLALTMRVMRNIGAQTALPAAGIGKNGK
jgi:uncharacterized protein YjgD (DUF1641 family)